MRTHSNAVNIDGVGSYTKAPYPSNCSPPCHTNTVSKLAIKCEIWFCTNVGHNVQNLEGYHILNCLTEHEANRINQKKCQWIDGIK